ncbi:glycine oxidase ThiO [Terrarubrum flagellatum]|uniref:glycine oxidase ThiO n=1 Tax=Terrirubrum flagellatum TaxID=2895980 RepID=UPI003144D732
MRVTVVGAGVAGLVVATELAERGVAIELIDRGERLGAESCSWCAGGMLAPWCERESAEPVVAERGLAALDWWSKRVPDVAQRGTLVVAPPRDVGELSNFARRTERFRWVEGDEIGELEPDLSARFRRGLFFPDEGHLDPRLALVALLDRLRDFGAAIRFGVEADLNEIEADAILDCRGFAARDDLKELRGVRGEMLVVRMRDVAFTRPIRLLHPRIPLYVVPRADHCFMIGATMVESAERRGVTARAAVDLLNAAYALHPAFAEAEIIEMRAGVRPAFPDNLPRVFRRRRTIHLNGFYRHGFLLSPAYARLAADMALNMTEDRHEDSRERLRA